MPRACWVCAFAAILLAGASNAHAANGYLYTGSGANIYGFAVNEATGALTLLPGYPLTADSSVSFGQSLALDRANARLYSCSSGSRTVQAYKINPLTGAATLLPFSGFVYGPTGNYTTIAIHPSGSPLMVGDFNTGNLFTFNITATTATAASGQPFYSGSNNATAQVFSADGKYYYVGTAGVSVNTATGVVTQLPNSPFQIAGGSGYATDSAGRLFTGGGALNYVGSSRVDLQACKLEYSIVSPK